ncbi:hypothetical protein L1987_15032 [Smallanthus sonchifolius]|uniref:Uncharacterized protein n=1 Tax=Smallanthus sonchifolius TaxID=185202 RepID=A0ACB9J6L5_9ASTR|nr:hypothetical protein L1987_15032 [Smallanthus sonchifolius]
MHTSFLKKLIFCYYTSSPNCFLNPKSVDDSRSSESYFCFDFGFRIQDLHIKSRREEIMDTIIDSSCYSSCDDGNSRNSIRVEEKIEKEWVVCDSEKDEDPMKVSEEVDFGYVDGELESEGVIRDSERVGVVGARQVFDEMPERTKLNDDGVDLVKSDEVEHESFAIDDGEMKLDEEDEVVDDDWQGIETTEFEKSFEAAVAFVDSKGSADRVNLIGIEVKVAIEGSCFEPQPMAINVSTSANWTNNDMKIYLG